MSAKDIRTSTAVTACDVCGRTLLRGEHSHAYLDGQARRTVCELCTTRAIAEGWAREGAVPAFGGGRPESERRRSLLGRLRAKRDPSSSLSRSLDDDGLAEDRSPQEPGNAGGYEPRYADPTPWPAPAGRARESMREPRHVRAIPTSVEQKLSAAVDIFNASEHKRTVAGVARSLGMPTVAVVPVEGRPGLIEVVVSWELCWYRYEIDLSDDFPTVRVGAQGYELEDLTDEQQFPNAVADERGGLALAAE